MSQHSIDISVFVIVVALRLIIPLFIPRFPLPAIVAAMLIDAADQTIFQKFTHLNLDDYQSYDKALDNYYLTIAFLATFRNWENLTAIRTARFLFFYRLAGVVLFESLGYRWLLFVFPNTFEYFFDYYELVALRWNPIRMTKRLVIGAAAAIWIFIKLPQEYWIHIAELDTTDLMRKYPGWTVVIVIAAVIIAICLYKFAWPKLPPKEWPLTFDADKRPGGATMSESQGALSSVERIWDRGFLEKFAMITMLSWIFAKVLPGVTASDLQLAIGTGIVIAVNTLLSTAFARRGVEWSSLAVQFVVMFAINIGMAVGAFYILRADDRELRLGNLSFFLFILTLVVVLYDHYRPRYLTRLEAASGGGVAAATA